MEITIDLLKSLSSDDIKRITKYSELLEEAEKAVEIIKAAYKFNIGEMKITVSDDGNNCEYLLHDGVWQARYLHQSYDVCINVNSIFDVFKENYEYTLIRSSRVNMKAESASYFRSFVNRCKKMLEKEDCK